MADKRVKSLTINRKIWLRGNDDTSALRNSSGSMCCLGHLGRACGIKGRDLLGKGTPYNVDTEVMDNHPQY